MSNTTKSTKYQELADESTKKYTEQAKQQAEEQTALVDQNAQANISKAERDTTARIEEADRAYIDMINQADIQKELDMRNIRETRANMGLSRSGLASTEMTAATLSAGNKTAAAQRQRQAAINTLRQSLLDYKNEVERESAAQKLSIKQTADSNILSYGDTKKTWALENDAAVDDANESNRRSGILSLDISDELKTQAIEEGWSIGQAAAKGKAVADQIENERKANLYAAWQNKEITEEIYRQAIADPSYDVDDALAAMATYTAGQQEESASFAASLLQSGAISSELYATAIRAGWDIPTIIDMANKAKTDTETQRVSAIDAAYQSGAISQYVRDYAKVNGLTANQAKLLEQEQRVQGVDANEEALNQNRQILEDLFDKDDTKSKLTPQVYSLAYNEGWDPTLALKIDEGYKKVADEMGQNGKEAAVQYVMDHYANDFYIFDAVCTLAGITDADIDAYRSTKANQRAASGIPLREKAIPETVYFN